MSAALPQDVLAAKRWLKRLREDQQLTQKELAHAMGTTTRVVINAEDESEESLPRGWSFYLMLRELGVLVDAPPASAPTLSDRLGSIEETIDRSWGAATQLLADLAGEVDALRRRLEPPNERATEGRS